MLTFDESPRQLTAGELIAVACYNATLYREPAVILWRGCRHTINPDCNPLSISEGWANACNQAEEDSPDVLPYNLGNASFSEGAVEAQRAAYALNRPISVTLVGKSIVVNPEDTLGCIEDQWRAAGGEDESIDALMRRVAELAELPTVYLQYQPTIDGWAVLRQTATGFYSLSCRAKADPKIALKVAISYLRDQKPSEPNLISE